MNARRLVEGDVFVASEVATRGYMVTRVVECHPVGEPLLIASASMGMRGRIPNSVIGVNAVEYRKAGDEIIIIGDKIVLSPDQPVAVLGRIDYLNQKYESLNQRLNCLSEPRTGMVGWRYMR